MTAESAKAGGIKTQALSRNLAITRLGLGMGSRIAAHLLINRFRSSASRDAANRDFFLQQARYLSDEIGRLKGSIMKAGQILALFGEYILPAEAVDALNSLNELSQPLPWSVVAPTLQEDIDAALIAKLEIDEIPIGAASLGQVHRARRKSDGLELCIKIQYPGVADSIDSDMRSLERILILSRVAPRGLDMRPILDEVRHMLKFEVDYERERQFTDEYRRKLKDDQRFIVPQTLPEYSSRRVLTMTYEQGVGIGDESIAALPLAERNHLGKALVELFFREFLEFGMVQTDPNAGNFRYRLDANGHHQIVLLDFGATCQFEDNFIRQYCELLASALSHDRPRLIRATGALGFANEKSPDYVQEGFAQMCETLIEPFNAHEKNGTPQYLLNQQGEYCWGKSDVLSRASLPGAKAAVTTDFRLPPREVVFLHRRLIGTFVTLASLKAEFNARDILLAALKTASN